MLYMSGSENADLEIVGFNGSPMVECGRALAVARRKSDGMHCVLGSAGDGAASAWYDEDEAVAFAAPRSCLPLADGRLVRQPMMVFAAQALLDTVGRETWPAEFHGELLLWRRLKQYDDAIQAACGSAESVESLLDDWGTCLKRRYDAMYHGGGDRAACKRVADFMLCAAKSRALRWQAHLRYAMVQEPERLRPTFDAFTRNEFPDMPFEAYLAEIKDLDAVLKSVPTPAPQTALPVSPDLALRK
jgi:hypothetical protein